MVWLRLERDRVDDLIRDQKKDGPKDLPPAVDKQRNEVRKIDGIPPPGQSLFKGKR